MHNFLNFQLILQKYFCVFESKVQTKRHVLSKCERNFSQVRLKLTSSVHDVKVLEVHLELQCELKLVELCISTLRLRQRGLLF